MSGVMVVRLHGRLLAVKRQGPNGPDRLRREAEVLGGLSHPGLVQLVDVSATEPIELRTVFVGPASWDRMPPSAPERVAALAAVAATVADLHELDTTHGAVHPSHVLTADDDRPVLCGLADAGPADDDGRASDLDGLAGLLEDIGGGAEPASVRARIDDLATRCRAGSLDARSLARELDHLARPSPPARTGVLTALDARRVGLARPDEDRAVGGVDAEGVADPIRLDPEVEGPRELVGRHRFAGLAGRRPVVEYHHQSGGRPQDRHRRDAVTVPVAEHRPVTRLPHRVVTPVVVQLGRRPRVRRGQHRPGGGGTGGGRRCRRGR